MIRKIAWRTWVLILSLLLAFLGKCPEKRETQTLLLWYISLDFQLIVDMKQYHWVPGIRIDSKAASQGEEAFSKPESPSVDSER